jgi:hypothetical protein
MNQKVAKEQSNAFLASETNSPCRPGCLIGGQDTVKSRTNQIVQVVVTNFCSSDCHHQSIKKNEGENEPEKCLRIALDHPRVSRLYLI